MDVSSWVCGQMGVWSGGCSEVSVVRWMCVQVWVGVQVGVSP